MPTTSASLKSTELTPDARFKVFLDIFAHPKRADDADHARRQREPGALPDVRAKYQAGTVGDLAGGLAGVDKPTTRSSRSGGGSAVSREPAARLTPRALDRRPRAAGRPGAAAASCSCSMSPWILGFAVFFGYPLVASAYTRSPTTTCCSAPRWVGLANYDFMLHKDPRADRGRRTRSGSWRSRCRCTGAVRVAWRHDHARRCRHRLLPHRLLPARRWRRRWPPRSASPTSSTRPPGRSTARSRDRDRGPLWFESPTWAKPSLCCCACGDRTR